VGLAFDSAQAPTVADYAQAPAVADYAQAVVSIDPRGVSGVESPAGFGLRLRSGPGGDRPPNPERSRNEGIGPRTLSVVETRVSAPEP